MTSIVTLAAQTSSTILAGLREMDCTGLLNLPINRKRQMTVTLLVTVRWHVRKSVLPAKHTLGGG